MGVVLLSFRVDDANIIVVGVYTSVVVETARCCWAMLVELAMALIALSIV